MAAAILADIGRLMTLPRRLRTEGSFMAATIPGSGANADFLSSGLGAPSGTGSGSRPHTDMRAMSCSRHWRSVEERKTRAVMKGSRSLRSAVWRARSERRRLALVLARMSGWGRFFSDLFGRCHRQFCPSPNRTPENDLISTRKNPRGVTISASISLTDPSSAMNSTFVHAR